MRSINPIAPAEILRLRKAKGWTQEQLAAHVGVCVKTVVCGWETGRSKPSGPASVLMRRLINETFGSDREHAWRQAGFAPSGIDDTWKHEDGRQVTGHAVAALMPEQMSWPSS